MNTVKANDDKNMVKNIKLFFDAELNQVNEEHRFIQRSLSALPESFQFVEQSLSTECEKLERDVVQKSICSQALNNILENKEVKKSHIQLLCNIDLTRHYSLIKNYSNLVEDDPSIPPSTKDICFFSNVPYYVTQEIARQLDVQDKKSFTRTSHLIDNHINKP